MPRHLIMVLRDCKPADSDYDIRVARSVEVPAVAAVHERAAGVLFADGARFIKNLAANIQLECKAVLDPVNQARGRCEASLPLTLIVGLIVIAEQHVETPVFHRYYISQIVVLTRVKWSKDKTAIQYECIIRK